MSEWEDFTESPCVRSGDLAFERAGVTPADIDTVQVYDAFTPMVLLTLEGLGFCKKGEGGAFVEDGKLRVGGALPTNTDGGGLSACQPGMRGMFLLIEAVRAAAGRVRRAPGARRPAGLRERHQRLVLGRQHGHPRPGLSKHPSGARRGAPEQSPAPPGRSASGVDGPASGAGGAAPEWSVA